MPTKKVKVKGEYTYPSDFDEDEMPNGGLNRALNVVINRDGVAEPRRGIADYRRVSNTITDRASQLAAYKDTLLAFYESALSKNNSDPFTQISGTFNPPDHGDSFVPKIKFVEANSNFYFTSDTGIKKMDSISSAVVNAGAPRGQDIQLTLTGSTGFMSNNSQVAYRIVWGYRDANRNVIIGAPSQRVVISNSAGAGRDVIVNSSIPDDVTTSWFYQVYRSALSGSSSEDPGDELALIFEDNPSSGDITNGFIQFTDATSDDLRGAALYTNASRQGISQANDRPPSAKDLCTFKNMTFYTNTIQRQNLTITLLAAGGNGGVSYASFTGDTTDTSTTVTNVSSFTGLDVGQTIEGAGIPAGTTIASLDSGAGELELSQAATATATTVSLVAFDTLTIDGVEYYANSTENVGNREFAVATSGTASQNIEDTALSLVRVINRNSSNTTLNAYYLSGVDDLPGEIFLEAKDFGYSAFTAIASSNGSAFSPSLPTSGTDVQSETEEIRNRVYISKIDQPEAVPRTQFQPIGAADQPILRVIPLREAVMFLKTDGVYRGTGTTPQNFVIEPLDLTVELLLPESAVALNNKIHAITDQGASTISDTGVGVISRPIEDQILDLIALDNAKTESFAVAYETERQYILFCPTESGQENATQQHVFNTFTQAWTKWNLPALAAIVNPADNLLYIADDSSQYIRRERKSGDYTDFADDELSITISAVNSTVLTLSSVEGIEAGDVIVQGNLPYSQVTSVDSVANTITIDVDRNFSTGAASIFKSYQCIIDWVAQQFEAPGVSKQVSEIKPLFKVAEFRNATLRFSSDLVFSTRTVPVTGFDSFLWGYFGWGGVPFGGYSGIFKDRTFVPKEHQRCTWLNVSFEHKGAYGRFAIAGFDFLVDYHSSRTDK